MKSAVASLALLGASLLLVGCGSTSAFHAANLTEVQLAGDNFEIVATDVTGTATAGYILGVSGGYGGGVSTFAVARVSGSGMLYGEAVADLWRNFEAEHGPVAGRNLALVNVRYDTDALNLIIYTQPTVHVRADVVEFAD